MDVHKEIPFESEICQSLAANGWLYAEGDAEQYDRARAVFPADVLRWIQETQPASWEALRNQGRGGAWRPAQGVSGGVQERHHREDRGLAFR